MTAEPTDTPTTSPTSDDSGRSGIRITTSDPLGSLRLAAICAIVLAAGVWAFTEFGIGRNAGSASGGDVSALGVVASELVTSAKTDGGASDAIGGYLPGTGVVLTVHLDELAGTDMQDWVSTHLDSYADDLSVLPSGESVVVTVDVASPQPAARVWSLTPDEINRTEGWERLVAPATFIGGEVAVAGDDADESVMDDESMDDDAEEAADESMADDDAADDDNTVGSDTAEAAPDDDAPEELATADADGDEADGDDADGDAADGDGADGDAGGPDADGEGGFYDSALWSPLFGSWVLNNGIYAQSDATGFGYSAEYLGDTPEQFDVSVSMRAPFGDLNSGLILGIPERGRKHGGTVIDITGEGTYLRWGAYDDETGEWSFVGGAPIDPALVPDEWAELKLEARADRTGIILNGEPIASIDPVEPGFVSLVVSVANIEFKDFVLEPVDGEPAEEEPAEEPAPAPAAFSAATETEPVADTAIDFSRLPEPPTFSAPVEAAPQPAPPAASPVPAPAVPAPLPVAAAPAAPVQQAPAQPAPVAPVQPAPAQPAPMPVAAAPVADLGMGDLPMRTPRAALAEQDGIAAPAPAPAAPAPAPAAPVTPTAPVASSDHTTATAAKTSSQFSAFQAGVQRSQDQRG